MLSIALPVIKMKAHSTLSSSIPFCCWLLMMWYVSVYTSITWNEMVSASSSLLLLFMSSCFWGAQGLHDDEPAMMSIWCSLLVTVDDRNVNVCVIIGGCLLLLRIWMWDSSRSWSSRRYDMIRNVIYIIHQLQRYSENIVFVIVIINRIGNNIT